VTTRTLSETIPRQGQPAAEVATWAVQGLEGLAFAHEAGVAHLDLQPYLVLVGDPAAICACWAGGGHGSTPPPAPTAALNAGMLASQRARQSATCWPSVSSCTTRWPARRRSISPTWGSPAASCRPGGREIVRLPFTTGQPVPEALRAIVNRATDRQERQRYRNARTLLRALQGWLKTDADAGGGPLALLLDRLHSVGLLPARLGRPTAPRAWR
jgi:hypothetical protein